MNLGGLLMRDTVRCQHGSGGLLDTEGQGSRSSLSLLLSHDLLCLAPCCSVPMDCGIPMCSIINRPYFSLSNYLHLFTFFSVKKQRLLSTHVAAEGVRKKKIDFSTRRKKGSGKPQEILGVSRQILAATTSK